MKTVLLLVVTMFCAGAASAENWVCTDTCRTYSEEGKVTAEVETVNSRGPVVRYTTFSEGVATEQLFTAEEWVNFQAMSQ